MNIFRLTILSGVIGVTCALCQVPRPTGLRFHVPASQSLAIGKEYRAGTITAQPIDAEENGFFAVAIECSDRQSDHLEVRVFYWALLTLEGGKEIPVLLSKTQILAVEGGFKTLTDTFTIPFGSAAKIEVTALRQIEIQTFGKVTKE